VREILEAAGYTTVAATPYEITTRGSASAVTDPALFAVMGIAPDQEEMAQEEVDHHLERFAVAPGEFEFPLAFMVYEAAA
jgi:hypothetical protein